MLDNTITLAYNAVNYSLRRVNQDNFGAVYRGTVDGEETTLTVKHTNVPRGKPGTSHMIRLDREVTDAEGALIRTVSVWTVLKTFDGPEDKAALLLLGAALQAYTIADSGDTTSNMARVVGGES